MKINELAKLTGITVRTLHYYDEINLLKPSNINSSGYRIYGKNEIERLQEILFLKELDFSLSEIKDIIMNPNYIKEEALIKQKEILIKKRERLNGIIKLLDKTIEGDIKMSFKEFDMTEIEEAKNKYKEETEKRFGETDAYKESAKKTANYDKDKWEKINTEAKEIMKEFADKKSMPVENDEVQKLVEKWQKHISDNFYTCTKEILAGLGMMYVADERFKKNIDKNGEGTAEYMAKAIEFYCSK